MCVFVPTYYRYPERRQPFVDRFSILKNNLINNGSFTRPRPKSYVKENKEIDETNVLAVVEATHSTSCRTIEAEVGVAKSRTQQILKKYKFKPYKIQIVQHLHPGDAERRLIFCNWYLQQIQIDRNFACSVIWSDEAYFSSAGIYNRQNTRHWYHENPHLVFEREQQGRFGFSVACFILGRQIAFRIYEGSLSGDRYLNILEDVVPELIDNVPLARLNSIYFQQDGAPAHNSLIIRPYLENHFPDKWIGTKGPIRWPPRSPDLSVLDFFLWGYLQNKVYAKRHRNPHELREAITLAFHHIQRRSVILLNALERITKLCELCIRENGNHFEQFL